MSFQDDFSIKLDLTDNVNQETRAVALKILTNVVLSTPVKTGRARGNWQVSLDGPIDSQIKLNDKGGGIAISKGASAINTRVDYPVIYITNNLPYIEPLNDGSST